MKKALGIIAVLGSAAALVAYKLRKDEQQHVDYSSMDEDDISERILQSAQEVNANEMELDEEPASSTVSFPHLSREDMLRLNEISDSKLEEVAQREDDRERPLQHTLYFENDSDLERYKAIVINDGYVVTAGKDEHELLVLNIVKGETDEILSRVFYLADLAKEHNGVYMDWILK